MIRPIPDSKRLRKQLETICYESIDHLTDEEVRAILTQPTDLPMYFDKLWQEFRDNS